MNRISLSEFRKRLKDKPFYRDILERAEGLVLIVPKRPSEELVSIRAQLLVGKKPAVVSRALKVDLRKVLKIKKGLYRPLRTEAIYIQLYKVYGSRTWKLIERLQGCRVYIPKIRRYRYKYILERYLEGIDPKAIAADPLISHSMRKPRCKGEIGNGFRRDCDCSLDWVNRVIRMYRIATDPTFIPQRYKSTLY